MGLLDYLYGRRETGQPLLDQSGVDSVGNPLFMDPATSAEGKRRLLEALAARHVPARDDQTYYNEQVPANPEAVAGLLARLGEGVATAPTTEMAKRALAAVPEVYEGKLDPTSDEGIGRAFEMAGLGMTGGIAGAPKGAITVGPARRMTEVPDLRSLTFPEAVEVARKEQHLIPKGDGGFVGGPRDVMNKRQLNRVRKDFDEMVDRGVEGGDWYDRYRTGVREAAGPNPERQTLLAREGGEFSAGVSPQAELMFALREHNGYELGEPRVAHFPDQHDRYMAARESGDLSKIATGDKTSVYALNGDPTVPFTPAGTNDFRNAQNFKYTEPSGSPQTQALNPQQHAFIDAETVLAADRANKRTAGGMTDWNGPRVQAAPWVAQKG